MLVMLGGRPQTAAHVPLLHTNKCSPKHKRQLQVSYNISRNTTDRLLTVVKSLLTILGVSTHQTPATIHVSTAHLKNSQHSLVNQGHKQTCCHLEGGKQSRNAV